MAGRQTAKTRGFNCGDYILEDTIISHYDVTGIDSDETSELLETVHLNFTKLQMKFIPRDANNQPEGPLVSGYDLAQGVPL